MVRREMCVEIQIISEHSPRVENETSSLCGYGHLCAECWLLLTCLLTALNQCDTIRKKQRYAFLIHFLPGIFKMWSFVGSPFSLFLIGAWDVRKHSDFKPCTVAEFTFNEVWGKAAFGQQGVYQPWPTLWASFFSSLMPSSSNMAGKFIATLFGKRLTPGWGFTSKWHFCQV